MRQYVFKCRRWFVSHRTWLGYVAIALLCYIQFFIGIDHYGIINGNESLYVESAREMTLTRQWAIPTLNGLPYLEKPPLLIWLITLLQSLLGQSEATARLVTALSSTVLALALVRYSVRLGIGRRGFAAAFILVTSLGVDVMSRVAMPDLLLTALFSGACLSMLVSLVHQCPVHARAGAAMLGLSALIKGPLSIALFALILIGLYWLEPSQRAWMRTQGRDRLAWLLLLSPLMLWLLAIEWRQPGAAYYFVINEHVLRFLGLREPHDYYSGSVFYYIPRLFIFIFPWAGILFFGWRVSISTPDPDHRVIRRFLWLCVWVPFVFFSVSKAKANYYVILCLPAMALLTADYLKYLTEHRHRTDLVLAVVTPVLLFVTVWMYRVWEVQVGHTKPLLPTRDGSGALTMIVLTLLGLLILIFVQMGWRRAAALCVGGLIVPVSFQFDHLVARAEPIMSARTLAHYIQQYAPAAPVYMYRDYEAVGALPIYLHRNLPIIDCDSNDLYFGRHQRPDDAYLVDAAEVLSRGAGSLIVVMKDRLEDFELTPLAAQAKELTEIGRVKLYQLQP